MDIRELQMLQALPLEIKILKSLARIREFINEFGLDGVYISYSGGKDSEVLCDIVRKEYPNIKIVFSSTGQEFPETIKQVLKRKKEGWNIEIVRPKMKFGDVVKKYGYPVISKEQSLYIEQIRNTKSEKLKNLRLNGGRNGRSFKVSEKWKYLIEEADFKISNKCCDILKKHPLKKFEKLTGRRPIIAIMADESNLRTQQYLKDGCNVFGAKRVSSRPMGFWKQDDVWQYIKENELEISECYTVHQMERTGCYGCLFGCHLEERDTGTNRILRLRKTHPKLHEHLMNNLNYKHVMKVLGLRTFEIEQLNLFEEEN